LLIKFDEIIKSVIQQNFQRPRKAPNKIKVAVAREFVGFVGAMMQPEPTIIRLAQDVFKSLTSIKLAG